MNTADDSETRPRRNIPSYAELWQRVKQADDMACEGSGYFECSFCTGVLELLRGGVHCGACGHINALGHDCDHWICDHESGTLCQPSEVPWLDGAPEDVTMRDINFVADMALRERDPRILRAALSDIRRMSKTTLDEAHSE